MLIYVRLNEIWINKKSIYDIKLRFLVVNFIIFEMEQQQQQLIYINEISDKESVY